jgi:hypothetical protein
VRAIDAVSNNELVCGVRFAAKSVRLRAVYAVCDDGRTCGVHTHPQNGLMRAIECVLEGKGACGVHFQHFSGWVADDSRRVTRASDVWCRRKQSKKVHFFMLVSIRVVLHEGNFNKGEK